MIHSEEESHLKNYETKIQMQNSSAQKWKGWSNRKIQLGNEHSHCGDPSNF